MNKNVLNNYCTKLISSFYALLCTMEGRVNNDTDTVVPREVAYDNYQKSLVKLKIELSGCVRNYENIAEFETMRNIVEGLKDITIDDHDILRSQVFGLINICKKIQSNYTRTDEE